MICSTSTFSERTEKSDMTRTFQGFPAIAPARLSSAASQELGRLGDAGPEDGERADEGLAARQLELGAVLADHGIAVRVRRQRLPVAEQPAPGALEHVAHHALRVDRIPETVVVDDA